MAWKGSSQILQNVKESPGLPAGRAESFPVEGELCLPATSVAQFPDVVRFQLVAFAISMARFKEGPDFFEKPFIQSLFLRG